MIITRTLFHMSVFGGGTDMESFSVSTGKRFFQQLLTNTAM